MKQKNKYRVVVPTEEEKERMKNWEVICITPFVKGMVFEKSNEQEKSH